MTSDRPPTRRRRAAAVVLLTILAAPLLAGCTAPGTQPPCDLDALLRDGVTALQPRADPRGGMPAIPGTEPDPRTTARVLIGAGLVRRAGYEGAFDAAPHVAYLRDNLVAMTTARAPVDSVPNNLSLAALALQVWGHDPHGVPLNETHTLGDAWDAHYDPATGRFGVRLNEHLFGAFAAWLLGPPDERLVAMAEHTAARLAAPGPGGDPTARDAWWAAYARAALGAPPADLAQAARMEAILAAHREEGGGVRGFASAKHADASTTAAAVLAWERSGEGPSGPHVAAATAYFCSARRADGLVPFRAGTDHLPVKTTAEVLIALALVKQDVPWGDGTD